MLVRTFYFDEFLKSLKTLKSTLSAQPSLENANYCVLEDHFRIGSLSVLNTTPIIQDDMVRVQLQLESYYPRDILVQSMKLSFEMHVKPLPGVESEFSMLPLNAANRSVKQPMLKVGLYLDYQEDRTLSSATVVCDMPKASNPVRRTSSTKRKLSPTMQSDFANFVTIQNVAIQPGMNSIELATKATRVGHWVFKQVESATLRLFVTNSLIKLICL